MLSKQSRKLSGPELEAYAARLLAARALSTAELRTKLRKKAAHLDEVERLIGSLGEYGAVDDQRFAQHYAESRASGGRQGSRRVLSDLLAKRIAPEAAKEAVQKAFADVDEQKAIEAWLSRKYRAQNLANLLSSRAKFGSVYRRLRTAGFGASASLSVLNRLAGSSFEADLPEDEQTGDGM